MKLFCRRTTKTESLARIWEKGEYAVEAELATITFERTKSFVRILISYFEHFCSEYALKQSTGCIWPTNIWKSKDQLSYSLGDFGWRNLFVTYNWTTERS